MALVTCKECGEEVSTKAKNCPKCGAKPPQKTSFLAWFVLIVILFAGYAAITGTSSDYESSGSYSSGANSSSSGGSSANVSQTAVPSWKQHTSKDEMTGAVQAFASSPRAASNSPMEFPYSGTRAWIGVGCDGKDEWSYIGFTQAPNLSNTDTKDGYNLVSTRVRWNDSVETTVFTQKWGASFLHFRNYSQSIARLAASKTVLLELDWHGQQPVYFEFTLEGSSDAISDIRKRCTG